MNCAWFRSIEYVAFIDLAAECPSLCVNCLVFFFFPLTQHITINPLDCKQFESWNLVVSHRICSWINNVCWHQPTKNIPNRRWTNWMLSNRADHLILHNWSYIFFYSQLNPEKKSTIFDWFDMNIHENVRKNSEQPSSKCWYTIYIIIKRRP